MFVVVALSEFSYVLILVVSLTAKALILQVAKQELGVAGCEASGIVESFSSR